MSTFLDVLDQNTKQIKSAMAVHYAAPYYDYSKGKWDQPYSVKVGSEVNMPQDNTSQQRSYFDQTSISVYKLGSAEQAYNLYTDKNAHSG